VRIIDLAAAAKVCCSGFAKRVANDADFPKNSRKIAVQGDLPPPAISPALPRSFDD